MLSLTFLGERVTDSPAQIAVAKRCRWHWGIQGFPAFHGLLWTTVTGKLSDRLELLLNALFISGFASRTKSNSATWITESVRMLCLFSTISVSRPVLRAWWCTTLAIPTVWFFDFITPWPTFPSERKENEYFPGGRLFPPHCTV
jgi:hypothetical protein